MGNQAHIAIGTRYTDVNADSVYDAPLRVVAAQFALRGYGMASVPAWQSILRPDLVNFETHEVWEIKRLGDEARGIQELEMYLDALAGANIPVVPGSMGAPGTYGIVTSPDGGVFEYGAATPGLIVYQPLNLPLPVPVTQPQQSTVRQFAGAAVVVGSAYVGYKVLRAVAIGFANPPLGVASLAAP